MEGSSPFPSSLTVVFVSSLLLYCVLCTRPQVAILDFGSQYSHLIARRVRELNVYCELYSCEVPAAELAGHDLTAIILSGGPSSVYEEGAPHVCADTWRLIEQRSIPVLGICYGMQELAHVLGGEVTPGLKHEYGKATVHRVEGCNSPLFDDLPAAGFQVWMSHGDKLSRVPAGFKKVAATDNAEFVAMENAERRMWGLQFHPEVTHTPLGSKILENFCINIAGAKRDWVMTDYAQEFIEQVREKVGENGHVLGAVSGGVDSTVAAVLMTRAIGDRFHAVLVDNGCLRKNEAKNVVKRLREDCGVNLRCVDASDKFLELLKGVTDPEEKRKIIGKTFIEVFQEEAAKIEKEGHCDYLLQGTLYPDVIESISYKGPSATIKTHHNVGGLPATMKLKLIEPLRELFKDEVRSLGMALGIDEASVWRHPFPGPGLAIRVLGEVTADRVRMLQEADAIMIEELWKSGHYRPIGQAFVVLLPVKSVGVMGDGRTYENVAAVRCVETTDYMTADFYRLPYEVMGTISNRIINEVRGINRVCYDISSKPPATIEWE
jgi:GMP synthase (glutamine-hydrolysing)